MPPLTVMIKPASGACNMRCRYCFYADEMAHRSMPVVSPMTDTTLDHLIRRAMRHAEGTLSLIFQGGEPTLVGKDFYRRLLTLERQYRRPDLHVTHAIQTNGYALDEAWCEIFREGNFLVGVSLDGTQALHDRWRCGPAGTPTWQRVTENLALLKRAGVEYNILCVVTEQMTDKARAVFDTLAPHGHLQFIPCLDGLDGVPQAWSLRSESYGRFLVDLFDCYESAFRRGHPVSIRTFDNYLAMLCGHRPDQCSLAGRCGRYFLVEADGSVYPCDFYALDAWRMGNVNTHSFGRLECTEAAQRFAAPLPLPNACRECPWLFLCRGGCRRDREPFGPDGSGMNRWCGSLQLFFEQRGARLHALAKEIRK